jgi:uncharacterized membrane protein
MKKATFGLDENVASALSYITFTAGIIFFLSEKENKTVRFHAFQSIILRGIFIVLGVVLTILTFTPGIGFVFVFVRYWLNIVILISIIYLIVKAYKNVKVKIPFISNIAEKEA